METVVWKTKLKASAHAWRLFGVSTISPSQLLTFGDVSMEYHLFPLMYRPVTLKMKLP